MSSWPGNVGRRPIVIEWKGSHRAPGDEVAPIDLRIDHVYLISCKYLSKITINASPGYLFQRLLQGPHGVRGADWYEALAPDEYQQLYEIVLAELGWNDLPADVGLLGHVQRKQLAEALSGGWPPAAFRQYEHLARVVAQKTAEHLGHYRVAHRHGMTPGRRVRHAALKGVFTDLGRGLMRVMGVTKMTVMPGFTLAALTLDRICSYRAKHRLDEAGRPIDKPKQARACRRTGTWADVIDLTA